MEQLATAIAAGDRVVSVGGLTNTASKARVLAEIAAATGRRFVIVTPSSSAAEDWETDLAFWTGQTAGPGSVLVIPGFETDPYSGASPHAATLERRAIGLWELSRRQPEFVVLPANALIERTISPNEIRDAGFVLQRGSDIPPDEMVDKLSAAGYVREDPLTNEGQFSNRGGIVDVWPPGAVNPYRLEFFGDTIDSIREFDAETQLSIGHKGEAPVPPMREFRASADDFRLWAELAREEFPDARFARNLADRTAFADEGESFSGWEFMMPLLSPLEATIFRHLHDAVFVVDEPSIVEQTIGSRLENVRKHFEDTLAAGDIALDPERLVLSPVELRDGFKDRNRVELRALGLHAAAVDEEVAELPTSGEKRSVPLFLFPTAEVIREVEISSRSARRFHGDFAEFARHMNEIATGKSVLAVRSHGMMERAGELIAEYGLKEKIEVRTGELSSGFEMPAEGLTVYSESDVFGDVSAETQRLRTAPRRSRLGAFISDFRDLKPGDLVVHIDHGIGRFQGLETIASQGAEREFLLLVYADDVKLFVPVERLDLVSRYSSSEVADVALDRLGGLGWQKTKAKAKRAMRDMADELLKLYAERKLVPGYAFSPDAPWQHEFEDAFPYELTPDQSTAIEDVKQDMETPRPMDRLIIGDVGYGKTEVAMRAAFKAVMDGKQVAVLSPTTVLAYQHYETFKKRFAAFPAKIDLLSRFRSKKDQKLVAQAAVNGDVDVLIGTHRLLSNDVRMKRLGLVVVDEEQRFGVSHKEQLKRLKKKVDVLTLSATPIPRTLNMSLLGMRDMSVIETPPRDRLAINTQVVQFSENVIRSAIELELSRNGQIFFIHNRVETIESIAALVQKIVPNARIAIGHGQMNEAEMEQVMLDFIDYKYDVLVATTIIENGIDIPRANTIIINRADNYGLSQLYQLRGRVGRSNRRAYAYLLIPSEIELTPIARRRLSAIREFSDLGAGFRLAALDLELRGAGNLLGGQQSGHLDALGFDLYTKMLERTIAEIRGDEIADETSVSINLGVDVSIPKDYIIEASHRLRTYKRISSAASDDALIQIRAEIEDRYGRLPTSVDALFRYASLRRKAERMRLVSIDKAGGSVAIKLGENATVSPARLLSFIEANGNTSFSPSGILRAEIGDGNALELAMRIIDEIRDQG